MAMLENVRQLDDNDDRCHMQLEMLNIENNRLTTAQQQHQQQGECVVETGGGGRLGGIQRKRQRVHLRRLQQRLSAVVDDDDEMPQHKAIPQGNKDALMEMSKICLLCRRAIHSAADDHYSLCNCCCCYSCCGDDMRHTKTPEPMSANRRHSNTTTTTTTPILLSTNQQQRTNEAIQTHQMLDKDYDPDGLKGGGGVQWDTSTTTMNTATTTTTTMNTTTTTTTTNNSNCSCNRTKFSRKPQNLPPSTPSLHSWRHPLLIVKLFLIFLHMHFVRVAGNVLSTSYNIIITKKNRHHPDGAPATNHKRLKTPHDSYNTRKHHQHQQHDHVKSLHGRGICKMSNLSLLYVILMAVSFVTVFVPSTVAAAHTSAGSGDASAGMAAGAALAAAMPAPIKVAATDLAAVRNVGRIQDGGGAMVKPYILPALKAAASNGPAPVAATKLLTMNKSMTGGEKKPVKLATQETVCKTMDIRNEPAELDQLRNCTVIEGFLIVSLMNTQHIKEFNETFPLLVEVTDFVLIYRVHNLRSLSQLFPNLSIIRGRKLLEGFALIVELNPHLEDIGLSKLLSIRKGGVRISNNLSLCYVETVDWSMIVSNASDTVHRNNRPVNECPKCPGEDMVKSENRELSCGKRHGVRRCWSSNACQTLCPKECPNNCLNENTCCNQDCLGGCLADDLNSCKGCNALTIHSTTCTDKCPRNFLNYLDRRCLTETMCKAIGTKLEGNKQETVLPFRDECLTTCPDGYDKTNTTCKYCGSDCIKKCAGGLVDSAERAKAFAGCTHIIENGLTISIKRGGRHLMGDLMYGLSSIKVVETFIKVHHTYGMFSLEFFKNLNVIEGKKLCENRSALYVLENNDLEQLWGANRSVRINNGRVFFHFNPKLCYSEIEALRKTMQNNAPFDKSEVATDTNGEKGSCNTEVLNITLLWVTSRLAHVEILNPLVFDDNRTFIGYQYYWMESKDQNATKNGHRVCDDGWSASEPSKDNKYVYSNLKPYTQYAYYVKTMTISSEPRNAQTEIGYFTTKSDQPKNIRKLKVTSDTSSSITVSWEPPFHVFGKLEYYVVRAEFDSRIQKMDSRNYCSDPVVIFNELKLGDDTTPTEKSKRPDDDCQCEATEKGVVDNDDVTLHEEITFENMIQNFIYVKQTRHNSDFSYEPDESLDNMSNGNEIAKNSRRRRSSGDDDSLNLSFLVRHMRAISDEATNEISVTSTPLNAENGSTTTTTSTTTADSTKVALAVNDGPYEPHPEERMDAKNEYYEYVVKIVNASSTEFKLPKLKHFATYVVGVRACREAEFDAEKERCSKEQTTYVRTLKMDGVDMVENLKGTEEVTNTTRSNVRLFWDPPSRPNGDVVSYTITYVLTTSEDAAPDKKCIAESEFRKMPNGYLLTGLQTGNYSITVRANSLAGDGIDSDPIFVVIPPKTISSTVIIIICLVVVIVLASIVYGVYYCRKKYLSTPSDLKMFPTVNPYYISLQYIADDWEVPRDSVIQLSSLGQGSFGMVYEGILKNNGSVDTPCAIKTVNENATDRERMNFLNEASVMKQFDTYHVVRLLGVCSLGQPALVIMELMKNGDLKSYLRAHRADEREELGMMGMLEPGSVALQPPPLERIYQMAIEIADGMAYLSAKKFVHRDLAARNCMVAADLTVKIGDFGMTRDIYETDYYRKGTKGLLPVRWMPPESLRDGVYSSASDVFSYGVVLWEMATLASQPYQGLSNDQVLRYVIDGGVMERPEDCPDKLYRLMQKCWHHRPSARPTFMEIITSLLDKADNQFEEVSFYYSKQGEQVRIKELGENRQNSGNICGDHDKELDDARTPLRAGDYNEYKLNMDNNSSVENHGDIDDDPPHSPYSLGSGNIISSTPDGQSKNSYNLSQMSHNNATTLSSAPSASGVTGGSHLHHHLLQHPHPHTHPYQRQLHQPMPPRYQAHTADDADPYVQPDFDSHEFGGEDAIDADTHRLGGAGIGKSLETDERGYEVYDPSPNYREGVPAYGAHTDDDDEGGVGGGGGGGKLSGGENLLPRLQKGRPRNPIIMPMSSSMPDEVISVPMSSSLHPSTASAASSNASSTATTTGKYPSLKKAVADTVHNVGNSLMPSRLRSNINRRFFHKRSGSNASHKSTSSNPNSNTNLTTSSVGGRGKSLSGQNLGTIESGGSGSAGSYTGAAATVPRFYTPAPAAAASSSPSRNDTAVSSNPNYLMLDESANASGISAAIGASDVTPAKSLSKKPPSFAGSTNPNYQLLNESLNTTTGAAVTPQRPAYGTPSRNAAPPILMMTSENPNYEPMQAPLGSSDNPNYMLMNVPDYAEVVAADINVSDNPNYQMMQAPPSTRASVSQPFSTLSAVLRREQSRERFHNSATSSDEDGDDDDDDDDADEDDDEHNDLHTEHIKMEKLPLNRQRSSERTQQARSASRSRSRSHSQAKSDERYTPVQGGSSVTSAKGGDNASAANAAAKATTNAFSLKEKWLRQQQSQNQTPPPPNGFIGREA